MILIVFMFHQIINTQCNSFYWQRFISIHVDRLRGKEFEKCAKSRLMESIYGVTMHSNIGPNSQSTELGQQIHVLYVKDVPVLLMCQIRPFFTLFFCLYEKKNNKKKLYPKKKTKQKTKINK